MFFTLVLSLLLGATTPCLASWDYGNGRHGSFVLTTSMTIDQLYQTVRLSSDPTNYNPADSNAIPNFQTLIITNGATLTANPWNGSNGGTIFLKVQGALSIAASSSISVSGIGYRGGSSVAVHGYVNSFQGESYAGTPSVNNGGANYGGGGVGPALMYSGGGGGGYGSNGGSGFNNGGAGGGIYGTASLSTVYLGSGGGGNNGDAGKNGGGAIIIDAGYLNVQGAIQALGDSAYVSVGGAGSGGSILLNMGSGSLGTNNVNALGGAGGFSLYNGYGGSGGVGRIAIGFAESFSGVTTPTAYTFNDTNSDTINITNQSVSQSDFSGTNVLLSVGFTTLSPFTMQWYFNGSPISGATNQSLSLPTLCLTNQGNYWLTISNLVITLNSSNIYLTVLDTNQPFADGIPNWWKEEYGLSTNSPTLATSYPPGDKLTYLQKFLYGLNPLTNDTDGDGVSDYDEMFVYHSNPLSTNTAGDGIPDGWKVQYGLNPSANDANNQVGATGVTYLQVYQYDTTHTNQVDPRNPFFAPGTSIYETLNNGQHTNRFYYDQEDRLIGAEYSRGVSTAYQYDGNGNFTRQTVLSRASETNGLPVLWLFLNGLSNQPGIAYGVSSGNGWDNYQEWLAGLSPNSNSVPSLAVNPGTNIASLILPFTPSNFVVGVGNLDGLPGDEIVVGADGNPGTNNNFLFVLAQTATNWSRQQISVGSYGITSIAVGQPANRPSSGIYVGLRGTNGSGQILEFTSNSGIWQSNLIAVSTNPATFVAGVRAGKDVLATLSPTNSPDGALWSLTWSNGVWSQQLVSTNCSHTGGITAPLQAQQTTRATGIRLLDTGSIEMFDVGLQLIGNGSFVPPGAVYNPATDKWYFTSPATDTWNAAQSYCSQLQGNLVTISSASENQWVQTQFSGNYYLGLSEGYLGGPYPQQLPSTSGGWADGSSSTYRNWAAGQPYMWATGLADLAVAAIDGTGHWSLVNGGNTSPGIGGICGWNWKIVLPTVPGVQAIRWPDSELATGSLVNNSTNSMSVYRALIDDKTSSGRVESGDDFVVFEYDIQTANWTTNVFARVPISSAHIAQSFGIATANYLLDPPDCLFSAEPDGQIFIWTSLGGTNVVRQLFCPDYAGHAWQGLRAVGMPEIGQGLAGLLVSQTNQNACNVIFWPPQAVLPTPQPSLIETAPSAVPVPTNIPLGVLAPVTVRLWDAEGDSSTPFLQYQVNGNTNWQNATPTTLDGVPYSSAVRVAALPTGANHTLVWNTLADLGSVSTNILVRARAQDFMLVGDWSVPVPYQVNTLSPLQINSGSANLQLTTNGFQMQISGLNGSGPVIIFASTNLIDWIPLFTNPAFNGTLPFLDPAATNFHFRFYRANEQ